MTTPAQPETIRVTLEARDARFLRAARDVLGKYTITRGAPTGPMIPFAIEGGDSPYQVEIHAEWAAEPTCTCPDAYRRREQHAGYCKHIIAVLLSNDELRCQLLELFL